MQQRTFPGKPLKRNSIRHILYRGQKVTQLICLIGNKSAQNAWEWSWKKATYWSLLLSGFSPRPSNFPLYELLQRLFWETWVATLFFSCFKSIYFGHIKTSWSHRFLSNWLTAYYIRKTIASNWLRSSYVNRKCLSLCNRVLCDVNSP